MAIVTVLRYDPAPPRWACLQDAQGNNWAYLDATADDGAGWGFNKATWTWGQLIDASDLFPFKYDDFDGEFDQVDVTRDASTWQGASVEDPDVDQPLPTHPDTHRIDLGLTGFIVRDSGHREQYDNGFVKDSEDGKHDFTRLLSIKGLEYVPVELIERLAAHMTKGAEKYGKENWRQATGLVAKARFLRSACRHFLQWVRGERDEDHGMAVCFNVIAFELTKETE